MDFSLIIPAFVAGVLTFLAPCTLPLVPGYLGFISGVPVGETKKGKLTTQVRRSVLVNGIWYVIGFSIVFMIMGTVFGILGSFLAHHRLWLSRIGGVMVIFFGLYMMHVFKFKYFNFLNTEKRISLVGKLKPGNPVSSFLFGATFAFGWTPCVGPVLGSILLLASTSGTAIQGLILLFTFSFGLGIPFIMLAFGFGHAAQHIQKLSKYLPTISFVGGLFLLFIGILLVTDKMEVWISSFYSVFSFINYESILNFL